MDGRFHKRNGVKVMRFRIGELALLGILAVFIIFINAKDNYKDVDVNTIASGISDTAGFGSMDKFGSEDVKKDFGININNYDGFIYYGHETVMQCEKVFILKLKNNSQADSIITTIKNQTKTNKELFQSYAPEQFELLNNSILEHKGNYIIYIVSPAATSIERSISDIIKG